MASSDGGHLQGHLQQTAREFGVGTWGALCVGLQISSQCLKWFYGRSGLPPRRSLHLALLPTADAWWGRGASSPPSLFSAVSARRAQRGSARGEEHIEVGQQDVDVAWDFYPKAVREKGRNIEKECNTDKGDAGVKSRGAGCPGWGSECCQENQDTGGSNEGSVQQDGCKGLSKAVEDAGRARRGLASWAQWWWTASGRQQPACTGGGMWFM